MNGFQFVLLLLAAGLFLLGTFNIGAPRFNFVAAGLCLMALAFLTPLAVALF